MSISTEKVRELRERTGVGILDCKLALEESGGDVDEAIKVLRKLGKAKAAEKASREASEGRVESYVHMGGKIGVLVELNCETDFVARSDDFVELAGNLAMQIAASDPQFLRREDVDEATLSEEREVLRAQAESEGKPPEIVDKMVEGRLKKYYSEACLYEQPYIRDPDKTVDDVITEAIARIGENIVVRRFVRFALGESGATLAASQD